MTISMYNQVIAVTNRHLCNDFLPQIEKVCKLHPKAIILREKDLSESEYLQLAKKVLEICDTYQVSCILHSFINVAKELDYKKIHLPLSLLKANANHLSEFTTIGCSIHSLDEAKKAIDLGATYLTAGHIYQTDCKKGVPPRGLSFLKDICKHSLIPVYAIGGIHLDKTQFDEILSCGASGGCIMSGMMKL